MGNLITTVGGFALASRGHIDGLLLLLTLAGLGLVIASACVFNNYFDRNIDGKMKRTQNRALVKGLVSGKNAIFFASLLGICGFLILIQYTNALAIGAALVGFLGYVVLYGICKYRTSYGTLIGSLSGAMPPLVGYLAASHRLDAGALILFTMIALWQMPHFFAIAMYRLDDYAAAAIPVLPLKKGTHATKVQMLLYVIAFALTSLLLTALGYTGYAYLTVAALLGVIWLALSIQGFKTSNDPRWARKMFACSLVTVTVLCIVMSLDAV